MARTSGRRHRWIRGDWQLAGWLLPSRARARRPAPAQPALGPVGVEAPRQPAPQPGPGRLDAAAAARMDRASAGLAVDRRGARDRAAAARVRRDRGTAAQAGGRDAEAAPRRQRRCGRPARRPGRADARVPALRGDGQSRRDPADGLADAGHAAPAARVESLCRVRDRARPRRRMAAGVRAGRTRAVDVDRAGHRRCRGDRDRTLRAGRAAGCRADPAPLGRLARPRVVDQPSVSSPRCRASRWSRRCSCARSRARPGPSSRPTWARTTTGCRRTISRSIRWRRSRIARRPRTWGSRCSGT